MIGGPGGKRQNKGVSNAGQKKSATEKTDSQSFIVNIRNGGDKGVTSHQ